MPRRTGRNRRGRRELGSAVGKIELRLWLATLTAGTPTALQDHDELRWLTAAELDGVDWLPIDRELLHLVRPFLRDRPFLS